MRPMSFLFPASLVVLAFSASAQTMPYPQPDAASAPTVQVRAPAAPAYLTEEEGEQINGAYAMSNGWRLDVKAGARYLDARIDKQKPMRLQAVTPDTFVSRDGSVTMQFNQGQLGDMVMSYIPDRRLAQVIVISSRMAQR